MPSETKRSSLGLRERKKQKTRALIQQQALRLFREQGYEATTVEQIAEASEVSPSTFFRYYPTKEDVVVRDAYDELFLAAVKEQPSELSPVLAVRETLHAFLGMMSPQQRAMEWERMALIMKTPALRDRMLGAYPDAVRQIANLIATRTGRSPQDYAAYQLAGGLLGVGLAAMVAAFDDPSKDYFALFDEGLLQLDACQPR